MYNGSFYAAASLTGRGKKKIQFMLASITIPIITVSFHFFPPFPGKNSPREERERGPTYSWEYHDWVLTCSAFHVRKMVIFPFPPSESLHLKDPNIFPLSPSQLGWFFHGKWSWVSIFPLWGSGDRLQNENISLLGKQNTVNVWNEVSSTRPEESNSRRTALTLWTCKAESCYNSELWKSFLTTTHPLLTGVCS